MKTVIKAVSAPAVALALSFALTACGGPAEEPATAPSDAATDVAAATPTDAAATPAATDTAAAATPTETASAAAATPTPTASAAAKPAVVAAAAAPAGPPQSFTQCSVCHKVEAGKNGIGPSLAGVFGAKSAHLGAGFKYSAAMQAAGLTWNAATLDRYLADPKGVVPGTFMSFGGEKDAAKRAEIIAYLKTL
ncbi:MAG: hypothetical protein RLZZ08_1773 [Pseudomonadota bacterium]